MLKSNQNTKKLPLNFKDKGFWRLALSLAIPIALQNMLSASFNLVDTLMVGQLGEIALSSVGMAGQWSWLMNMVMFGICSGASVFISQYWGDKNTAGIHKTTGIALVSAVVLSLMFTLIALLIPEQVIMIFNRDPDVIKSGAFYLRYACLSYPAVAISFVLGTTLRSCENVKLPMIVSGISTLLNAVFNYILIFPAGLGVKGAAIATVVSSWLGVILLYLFSLVQKNIIIAKPRQIFSMQLSDLPEFFKKAAPVIINETMWGMGSVCYNIIYSNLGYDKFAAITIVKTFENIAFCFFVGLCNACCVMVGKSIGAGDISEGIRDSKRFNILMLLSSLLTGVLIIAFRSPLVSVFNLGNQVSTQTLELAEWIIVLYGAWIVVRNIPYILIVGVFRPGGDTMTGMKYELFILWCFAVPATFVCAYILKLPFLAVYAIMYFCEDAPKSIIFMRHYFSNKWIKPVTEAGRAGLEEFNK